MVDRHLQLVLAHVAASRDAREDRVQVELARQPLARPRFPDVVGLRGPPVESVHPPHRDRRRPRVLRGDPLEDHAQHVRPDLSRHADGRLLHDRTPSHGLRGRVCGVGHELGTPEHAPHELHVGPPAARPPPSAGTRPAGFVSRSTHRPPPREPRRTLSSSFPSPSLRSRACRSRHRCPPVYRAHRAQRAPSPRTSRWHGRRRSARRAPRAAAPARAAGASSPSPRGPRGRLAMSRGARPSK